MSLVAIAALLAGCLSPQEFADEARQRLLESYPLGTTRSAVRAEIGSEPDISETMPGGGWASHSNAELRERALTSESRTGRAPQRIERSLVLDGPVGSCWIWFYYDPATASSTRSRREWAGSSAAPPCE